MAGLGVELGEHGPARADDAHRSETYGKIDKTHPDSVSNNGGFAQHFVTERARTRFISPV